MPDAGELVRASHIGGDVGCHLRRAAVQSVNTSSATAISWDTEDEDTDGFIAATASTVTIPAGLGGLYAITAHLICTGITGSGAAVIIDITSSPTGFPGDFLFPLDTTRDRGSASIVVPLAAADTFNVQAFHATGSAIDFTAYLFCYRIAVI